MTWDDIVRIGLRLPEVEEGIWFRTPSLKVRGKSFVRLKEDREAVVFLLDAVEEQEFLCATQPQVYYITSHYRGYPAVLARLAVIDEHECEARLRQGWRIKAPKTLRQQQEQPARLPLRRD